jgi:nucleotide-binding universal stress UspA family protein
MTTRPILVGYDGSHGGRDAARWALGEATRSGRPVHLLYAFQWMATVAPIMAPPVWPEAQARTDVEAVLRSAADDARESYPDVVVTTEVMDGPPTVGLRERSAQASLLVLGSRGHGGFAELLVGSTAIAVAAHAHCPVVVVRGVPAGPETSPESVVVGVDGSEGATLALEFAIDQAVQRQVPLRVVRVWTPPPPAFWPVDFDETAVSDAEHASVDDLLTEWRQKHPELRASIEIVVGDPARALIDASRDAQLVVVGSRGRGGFRGLLLGSVSQHLIHHSRCPVVVVRELPQPDQLTHPA